MVRQRFALASLFLLFGFLPAVAQSLPVAKLSGGIITTISDGDVVHPAFSPDGKTIAYSRVVVRNKMELCEVVVRTLPNGRPRVLLTAERSRKYATYAAFVVSFDWVSSRRLTAWIVDGDVDSTGVTFDVITGRIVKTDYSGLGDIDSYVDPALKSSVARMLEIDPKLPRAVVESAFQRGNGAFMAGPDKIVFKHEYSQYPDDVQIADLARRRFEVILKIPSGPPPFPHLLGGFDFGKDIYFAVTSDSAVRLFRYNGESSKEVWKAPITESAGAPSLSIAAKSDARVIFAVEPLQTTSKFSSDLFVVDMNGLRRIEIPAGTIETVIQGDRIAICYRDGAVRRIVVRNFELK